ncbi:hypothetical protein E2C05_02140 [Paracraurococcus ruber]|uniref:hypothetical protein n=1 Tax=Paracraurococcus ruber TaxID=77675 RepID=UPI0010581D9F|nr:hypothetical protein [Paracraurococcus ruber]TDG33825.1 hypothetical protein E2C05_02140 [Paracraurococcus ruber]
MRLLPSLVLGLIALPALGQVPRAEAPRPAPLEARSDTRSPGPPIDQGPRDAEANAAHRGGGAVLEGAPGAPPPLPTPAHDRRPAR